MKKILFIIFSLFAPLALLATEQTLDRDFEVASHPRLFMDNAMLRSTKKAVKEVEYWGKVDAYIIEEAKALLDKPTREHRVVGRRLLGTSREVLCRVSYLSYAYRTTGNKIYAKRAEEEMLKVATFSDWNPSHFLDVAEMTAALALGYDWLYSYLSKESRVIIQEAIMEKGLRTSLEYVNYRQWNENKNNWNQVCHTGLSLGAMAVWECNPELCQTIVERAIDNIQIPMKNYEPAGAFAEGAGYWEYGTLFNVLFLDALESSFGKDYGLLESHAGFSKTANYISQVMTPNGNVFNYGDNSIKAGFNIAPFWFAKKFDSYENLTPILDVPITRQRFLPMALIWGHKYTPGNTAYPEERFYVADGETPVAIMRSEWGNPDAQFVGVKLGTCTISHSHLDIGSFIYESQGVRWVTDMGADNYDKLEKAGVDLWNRDNGSQRWDAYRYGNGQHNVVTLNSRNFNVEAITKFNKVERDGETMTVGFDCSDLYTPWAKSVTRELTFIPNEDKLVISDNIVTPSTFTKMDWTIMSETEPEIVADGIVLRKDGKAVKLTAETSLNGKWHFEEAVGSYSFDSPNPGVYRIRYSADLELKSENKIVVIITKL